jgi:hypothetical protein
MLRIRLLHGGPPEARNERAVQNAGSDRFAAISYHGVSKRKSSAAAMGAFPWSCDAFQLTSVTLQRYRDGAKLFRDHYRIFFVPQTLIDEDCAIRHHNSLAASAKRHATAGRTIPFCAACLWIAAASFGAGAQPAQQQKNSLEVSKGVANKGLAKQAAPPGAVPTPPRRPANRPPPAAAPSEPPPISPEPSRPLPPPLSPPAALPPLDLSVPPPTLPRASRQAMRRCALEWEKMKREGQVGSLMWREFATKCLTR